MSRAELTRRILDRLEKQVAFGGKTQRKTVEGEIILKCPVYNGAPDLRELASDLTQIFVEYVGEEGFKRIKTLLNEILKSE